VSIDDVKKIFEIAAIVIAGLWAYFGYRVLKHREKAVAELQKLVHTGTACLFLLLANGIDSFLTIYLWSLNLKT
jgi:hypothetical protein